MVNPKNEFSFFLLNKQQRGFAPNISIIALQPAIVSRRTLGFLQKLVVRFDKGLHVIWVDHAINRHVDHVFLLQLDKIRHANEQFVTFPILPVYILNKSKRVII